MTKTLGTIDRLEELLRRGSVVCHCYDHEDPDPILQALAEHGF